MSRLSSSTSFIVTRMRVLAPLVAAFVEPGDDGVRLDVGQQLSALPFPLFNLLGRERAAENIALHHALPTWRERRSPASASISRRRAGTASFAEAVIALMKS